MSKEENFKLLKIQTIVLKVHIHCEGCKKKVKKLLQKVDGVYTIDIDAEQQKVTVTGNIDSETLIKKLVKSGKPAELWPTPGKGNQQKHQNEQKPHKVQFDLSDQKPLKGQEAKDQKPQKGGNKGVVDWFDDDFEFKEWKDKVNGCDGKKGGGGGGDNGGGKKSGGGDNGGGKKGGGGDNGGGKKGGGGGDGQNKGGDGQNKGGGGGGDGGKKGGGGDGQNKAVGGGGNEGKNNGSGKKGGGGGNPNQNGGGGNPNQNGGGGKKNGGGDGGDNQNGGKKNGGGDGGDYEGGGDGGGGEANKNGGGGGSGGGGKKGGKKGGNGGGDGEGSINGYGDGRDFNNPPMMFGVPGGGGGGVGIGVGCTCHGVPGGYHDYAPTNFHSGYRGNVNDRYMMMAYRPQYPMPNSHHNPADDATHLFSDENTSGCSIM